jgi:branched-chain amino acid transport system ATP-binding protein
MSEVRVEDLTGGYGSLMVLREVTIEAPAGQLTLVAGPNGAGKTTLMSFLIGTLRPTAGRVLIDGEDITPLSVKERLPRGIALIPEGRGLFPSLTVRENLRVAGTAIGLGKKGTTDAIERAAETFPIIAERSEQKVGKLSGGQQQMVAIARGLMGDPRVLLLDEPSMGLAPIVWAEVLETARRLATEGKTVILVEQRILDAIAAADRCAILQQGRVVRQGAAAELADDPELFHDYVAVRTG